MCRLGALELSNLCCELEKNYGDLIKVYGITSSDNSLNDFKKLGIFRYPLFIAKKPQWLKSVFKFDSPGLLKCYGFCNKSIIKRFRKARNLNLGYDFKGNFSDLGGIVLLNNKGKIFYSYNDKYLGDSNYLQSVQLIFEKIVIKKFAFSSKRMSNFFSSKKELQIEKESVQPSFVSSNESSKYTEKVEEKPSEDRMILQNVKPDDYFELSSVNVSKLKRYAVSSNITQS